MANDVDSVANTSGYASLSESLLERDLRLESSAVHRQDISRTGPQPVREEVHRLRYASSELATSKVEAADDLGVQ